MLKKLLRDSYIRLPIITQKSLVYSLFDGSFALLYVNLMGSALTTGFVLYLGATSFHVAVMTALSSLGQVTQVFSAFIEERHPKRKKLVSLLNLISRQTCWLLPFLLFIESFPLRMVLLLSLWAFAAMTANMGVNIWQSWMSDLVPAKIWGAYFGVRTTIQNISAITGVFIMSYVYQSLQGRGLYHASFFLLFACAGLSALAALFFLLKIEEPPYQPQEKHSFRQVLNIPFEEKRFRQIIFFLGFWSFAIGLSAPFFSVHMITFLGMKYTAIAIYTVITTSLALAAYPLWGKMLDQMGAKSVLWHSIIVVSVLPWLWLAACPSFLFFIWLDALLTGVYWPAINAGLFNLVLTESPRQNRSAYLAMQSAIGGIFTFLGAMTGGLLARHLASFKFEYFGQIFISNHLFFLVSGILRAGSLICLRNIKELPVESAGKFYSAWAALCFKVIKLMRENIIGLFSKNHAFSENPK